MYNLTITNAHEIGKYHSVFEYHRIDSIDLKAVVDRIFIVVLFLHGNNMDTYYYSRHVDLYIFYHTDDRLSFLM